MQSVLDESVESRNINASVSTYTQRALDNVDASSDTNDSTDHRLETPDKKYETSPTLSLSSGPNADEELSQSDTKQNSVPSSSRKPLKRTMCTTSSSPECKDSMPGLDDVKLMKTESGGTSHNPITCLDEKDNFFASCLDRSHSSVRPDIQQSNVKAVKSKSDEKKILHLSSTEMVNNNLDNTSDPDDGKDKGASAGSELIIAAYNNFVRRLVDETLDRSVTFCEQPRHAITALESMCSKAWPNLESKRHRNRIRAYLKACRRNSKKNRGFINMKEPPTNGLSMEAKHLVANAMNLVTDEVEQLKKSLNVVDTKLNILSGPEPESKTEIPKINIKCDFPPQDDYQFPFEFPTFMDQGTNSTFSANICEKLKIPKCTWNPITNITTPNVSRLNSSDSSGSILNSISNPAIPCLGFDPNYVATMLRFLPTSSQCQDMDSLNVNNPFIPNFQSPFGPMTKYESNETKMGSTLFNTNSFDLTYNANGNFTSDKQDFDNPQIHTKRACGESEFLRPNENLNIHPNGNCFSQTSCPKDFCTKFVPLPAHISSAHYSPTMNRAMSRLMDHYALSQDDLNFFRQNTEFTKEAIKYARGVSRLILKKVELLENQIYTTANGLGLTAVNLT